eukprot:scaffold1168_cov123-Isochrysis_galbana.AAC.4
MPSESDSSERVHLAAEWVGVVKGGWVGQSGDEEVKRAPSCDVGWLCGVKRELASERVPTQVEMRPGGQEARKMVAGVKARGG